MDLHDPVEGEKWVDMVPLMEKKWFHVLPLMEKKWFYVVLSSIAKKKGLK